MNRIFKFSMKEGIKSKQYLAATLIVVIISLNGLINSVNTSTISLNLFYYFMFSVFICVLMIPISLSIIVLNEKTSGRCEYYLANNVKLSDLIGAYSKTVMILSFIPVIIYHIITNIYSGVVNKLYIINVTLNFRTILFIFVLAIFTFIISRYLTILIMISKKPDTIKTFLMVFNILGIYAVVFPINYLVEKGVKFNLNNVMIYYIVIILLLSIICTILTSLSKNKLNNETIILSYKE